MGAQPLCPQTGRRRWRRGRRRACLSRAISRFDRTGFLAAVLWTGVMGAAAASAGPSVPSGQSTVESARVRPPAFKRFANGDILLGEVRLHRKEHVLSFPARINMLSGALEVLIATPAGRLHESLLSSPARPLHLQTMLYLLGLANGSRLPDKKGRRGALVDLDVEWKDAEGEIHRDPIENFVLDRRTGRTMRRLGWVFTGSALENGRFLADLEGNLVLLFSSGETVLDCADPDSTDDTLFSGNARRKAPPVGAAVRVFVIPRKPRKSPEVR